MNALSLLTNELLAAAGELAALVPGIQPDTTASTVRQVESLDPTLDTPTGQQQLIDLLERTAQEVLAVQGP
ncbi:MAG: hypothetical protein QOF25_3948 [Mycobacterium sp.]|jgi:hypothetical protein|nr:hypothetical protein [Mycobacterium sp.]